MAEIFVLLAVPSSSDPFVAVCGAGFSPRGTLVPLARSRAEALRGLKPAPQKNLGMNDFGCVRGKGLILFPYARRQLMKDLS